MRRGARSCARWGRSPARSCARALRVRLGAITAVTGALALAVTSPVLLLVASPILFGVPHLLADVRYLVVRPGLHRRLPVVVALAGPLAIAAAGNVLLGAALAPVAASLVARSPNRLKIPLFLAVAASG